jgi:hypothetical protein
MGKQTVRGDAESVSLRKSLRSVIRMHAGQVGGLAEVALATPTMQAVQESWKGPGSRHASGVWGF